MTPTEKFSACINITELMLDRRRSREEYEWKFCIALWALILASIQFSYTNQISDFGILPRASIAVLVLWLYYQFWLRGVHMGHKRYGRCADHYLKQAETILESQGVPLPKEEAYPRFLRAWGMWFQFSVTTLLLVAFVMLHK